MVLSRNGFLIDQLASERGTMDRLVYEQTVYFKFALMISESNTESFPSVDAQKEKSRRHKKRRPQRQAQDTNQLPTIRQSPNRSLTPPKSKSKDRHRRERKEEGPRQEELKKAKHKRHRDRGAQKQQLANKQEKRERSTGRKQEAKEGAKEGAKESGDGLRKHRSRSKQNKTARQHRQPREKTASGQIPAKEVGVNVDGAENADNMPPESKFIEYRQSHLSSSIRSSAFPESMSIGNQLNLLISESQSVNSKGYPVDQIPENQLYVINRTDSKVYNKKKVQLSSYGSSESNLPSVSREGQQSIGAGINPQVAKKKRIQTIHANNDLPSERYAIEVKSEGGSSIPRVESSIYWYFAVLFSIVSIPLFNLYLVYAYPYAIDKGPKIGTVYEVNPSLQNNYSITSYTGYYIELSVYLVTSAIFIGYTLTLGFWMQRMRLFLMIDTMLIAEVSSGISFGALHIQYFCWNYYYDAANPLNGPQYVVGALDVLIILMYGVSNFAMVAAIRSMLAYTNLSRWKVLSIKILMMLSSLTYISVGIVFLFGEDPASTTYNTYFDSTLATLSITSPVDNFTSVVVQLKTLASLGQFINAIENFMLLYVFTNFGFFFEIYKKISDFDGTSQLETHYEVGKRGDQEYESQSDT